LARGCHPCLLPFDVQVYPHHNEGVVTLPLTLN